MDRRQFVLGALLVCLLCGAAGQTQPDPLKKYAYTHPQMGTVFRIVFYAEIDSTAAESVARAIFDRVDTLNAHFSDWLPESELSNLAKQSGSGSFVSVSPEMFDILKKAQRVARQSDGAFDVTIGPLTRLWRRSRNLKVMPDSIHLQDAVSKTGWRNLELRKGKVRLARSGMMLDLGGIAQGWAADECLRILKTKGIPIALIDAGGDIRLGAKPPGAKGWKIAVPGSGHAADTLFLHHCGITTSGATFRYLELEGKRYSHIIDPKSGMPLQRHTLVTVLAPEATSADAWATGISVLGNSGWRHLKRRPTKIRVWITESEL